MKNNTTNVMVDPTAVRNTYTKLNKEVGYLFVEADVEHAVRVGHVYKTKPHIRYCNGLKCVLALIRDKASMPMPTLKYNVTAVIEPGMAEDMSMSYIKYHIDGLPEESDLFDDLKNNGVDVVLLIDDLNLKEDSTDNLQYFIFNDCYLEEGANPKDRSRFCVLNDAINEFDPNLYELRKNIASEWPFDIYNDHGFTENNCRLHAFMPIMEQYIRRPINEGTMSNKSIREAVDSKKIMLMDVLDSRLSHDKPYSISLAEYVHTSIVPAKNDTETEDTSLFTISKNIIDKNFFDECERKILKANVVYIADEDKKVIRIFTDANNALMYKYNHKGVHVFTSYISNRDEDLFDLLLEKDFLREKVMVYIDFINKGFDALELINRHPVYDNIMRAYANYPEMKEEFTTIYAKYLALYGGSNFKNELNKRDSLRWSRYLRNRLRYTGYVVYKCIGFGDLGLGYDNQFDGKPTCEQTMPRIYAQMADTVPESYKKEIAKEQISERIPKDFPFKSPQEIKAYLDTEVYGQEEAKIAASMVLWDTAVEGRRTSAMFIGPTGCGKTEIWRVLKKKWPHIYIENSTNITQEGWKGERKSYSRFLEIAETSEKEGILDRSIIVYDEFDKFCAPQWSNHGNISPAVQAEFLKLMEDDYLKVPEKDKDNDLVGRTLFDTSKDSAKKQDLCIKGVSMVFLGCFDTLRERIDRENNKVQFGLNTGEKAEHKTIGPEELIEFGVIREIMGRISSIATLDGLSEEDYVKMLMASTYVSPLKRLSVDYRINLGISEKLAKEIAHEAIIKKLGARYIKSRPQEILNKYRYYQPYLSGDVLLDNLIDYKPDNVEP